VKPENANKAENFKDKETGIELELVED